MRTYPRKKKKRSIIAGSAAPAGRTARPYPPNTNFWEALCRKATKGNRDPEENDRKPPTPPGLRFHDIAMACQGETLERSGTSKEHRTSRDHSAAASRFGADSRPFSSLPAPKLAGPAAPRSPVPHETPDRRDQSPVAGRRGMRASDSGAMRAAARPGTGLCPAGAIGQQGG